MGQRRAARPAAPITVVAGTAPDSLDPGFGYTTQAAEADWLAYTGLTTYAHANGQAGGQVIPGLATALPTVSNGGKTYTVTLRKGLVFSNGKPVKASDFPYTIERSMKLPWGGSGQFYGGTIVGAADVRRRQGEDDLRDHGRRRHRQDHDPPDRSLRRRSTTCWRSRRRGWCPAARR